jgi:hypothetical protein
MKPRTKLIVTSLSLWTAFSLVSLLNATYTLQVDYIAYQYGFPFTWLVHQLDGLFPMNIWMILWYPALLDFAFWLLISLALGTAILKTTRHFFRYGIIGVVLSIPFLTFLSFDPFLMVIGLFILGYGLVSTVLEFNVKNPSRALKGSK